MKQVYYLILTILTMALLALMTFVKLNEVGAWVNLTSYMSIINIVSAYGPLVLLCLFAFGGVIGKAVASKIILILIAILLVVFSLSYFAPEFVASILDKIGA